jgi:hypothetical protein
MNSLNVYIHFSEEIVSKLYQWHNTLLNKEHNDFSSLYWITKLHKNPYTENNTTGASTFSKK